MKNWGHISSFHVSFLSYGPQIAENSDLFDNIIEILKKLFNFKR